MSHFVVVPAEDSSFYLKEGKNFLGLSNLKAVKQYEIYEYDTEVSDETAFKAFKEYEIHDDITFLDNDNSFRFRQILGQYDELDEMTGRLVHDILNQDVVFNHSRVMVLDGLDKAETDKFLDYFVNETEIELVPFEALSYEMGTSPAADLAHVAGFIDFDDAQLEELIKDYSMDMSDIRVVQDYFKEEGVDPTIFQLKVIDTYWSDHCRHTTFLTELKKIDVKDGQYKEAIEKVIAEYNDVRSEVYNGKKAKLVSLMDLGTINAKYAKQLGLLDNQDVSDEVNACCVKIKVDVDGEEEDFLLYFKNETHNHPTEIEPFGGAATCIGGGIRDPLSGRSFVHQALRMVGAGDPTEAYEDTLPDKLPQRVLAQRAVTGYSDYGNQIGQTAGYVEEFYHPGFKAKRMELGALVAAAPVDAVVREEPIPGDVVMLLGGPTGRDGLGAAVGSSMTQTEQSKELQGAEVQKGNPGIERKIIRLFRNPEATRLIKKCNDFGAGGVSVAIGELAPGLDIQLDKVPLKYEGMDPAEIALSESQERMAVVIAKEDVEHFVALAHDEDIEATTVAEVTDSPYMIMNYNGEEVLRLRREFLDSNGGKKEAEAIVDSESFAEELSDERNIEEQLSDVRNASQKAIGQSFDYTLGKGTVLAPFGGKNGITPQQGMVAKIPVLGHETHTVSVMAGAFLPYIAEKSPFHGAYYAVIQSIAKAIALGAPRKELRLSFQEFFESMESPEKWGKPTGALLGAFHALTQLKLGSIGGKDSMSGTFKDMIVPPSLISFAVAPTKDDLVNSRELKATDSKVMMLEVKPSDGDLFDTKDLEVAFDQIETLLGNHDIRSISITGDKTVEVNLVEMALGNGIGFELTDGVAHQKHPLAFLIEVAEDVDVPGAVEVARTNANGTATIDGQAYDLKDLSAVYTKPLADVFNDIELEEKAEVKPALDVPEVENDARVLIIVTNGVNGEYDLYESFKQYTPNVDTFVIREELDYEGSIKDLKAQMANYDVLAFADGSIFSDRPAKGYGLSLILDDIADELETFIKDHYILAVGSALAAFVEAGWIEFGEAKEGTQLHYITNPYEKFISTTVDANVVKESEFASEGSYTTALASYTLSLKADGEQFKDQILSSYTSFLPGEQGIDAITDPSGHILGINSNTERFYADGLINTSVHEAPFIANLVKVAGE
ncbi:phosphoribosylformylglycinamidine synthase subunit PurQ [Aerococcus vaginalis]